MLPEGIRKRRGPYRSVYLALALVLLVATTGRAESPALEALGRSLNWLEANPPDPDSAKVGNICLDAWAWWLFATFHPDDAVRARAGVAVDQRLRALRPPTEETVVALSYWATLLRLLDRRGIDSTPYRAALAKFDVTTVLSSATPTTRWWTAELLRRSGIAVETDFASTFIATMAASNEATYTPTRQDAYRLFHEIVPATDLGQEPLTILTPPQQSFARGALPGLFGVSQADGDTDAVAEVLVSAALLGQRDTAFYAPGLQWLLDQQRPTGAYVSARDRMRPPSPNNYRHVVLVASWAVLTSLQPGQEVHEGADTESGAAARGVR